MRNVIVAHGHVPQFEPGLDGLWATQPLLALVQRGCDQADFPTAIAPALAQAHADLATYLATVLVGLFGPARLDLLPEALADNRSLAVVTRALLAQINYSVDASANTSVHHGQRSLPL